jgi:hypothetical protein
VFGAVGMCVEPGEVGGNGVVRRIWKVAKGIGNGERVLRTKEAGLVTMTVQMARTCDA